MVLLSASPGLAQESCLHGFVRCITSEMEFVSFCFSLGLTFLAVAWRSKAVAVRPGYQGTCKLIQRAADCNRKHLTSVPQDLPANTEELFLDFNEVQTLTNSSLQRYSSMWSLSLSQNKLKLIEPTTFFVSRRLSVLNLEGNCVYVNYTVTAAALHGLPSLRKLDLSGNYLTEDMAATLLQNLSLLESLSLARNVLMRLDSVTFADLIELRELSLERNYIYEIEVGTFKAMKRLQRLNLAYNQITCIVGFSLTQLRVLNASYNSIEWFLSDESSNEFDLETLDLSSNQLLFFPLLPKHNRLHSLLLSDNRINFYENLSKVTFLRNGTVKFLVISNNVTSVTAVNIWEDITLGNVSSLQFLDMSRNQFWYLPEGFLAMMTSLSQLKLNQNCFQAIHLNELDPLRSLVELDLSQNQLSELRMDPNSKSVLPNLRTLNVSTNRLNMLPAQFFNHMKYITTVDLSNNHVNLCPRIVEADNGEDRACTDFRNVTSLKHLYLAGCGLVVPHAFSGTSLTHLDLSNNYGALIMGTHPLQDVASTLQFLSLRNTSLTSNIDTDFSRFQSLLILDISENSLAQLPPSLSNLQLRTLNVRSNHLQSFPLHMAHQKLGKSLHMLYLSKNPYDCCKLTWWNYLRNLRTVHIADTWLVTCNHSSNILPVMQLPDTIEQDCRWKMTDSTLMYLVLTLPTSLTLLVALVIVFLTFKDSMLKAVKRRCRRSRSY